MLTALIIAGIIALLLVAGIAWERKRSRDFERKWPAISDDEFVAKCASGTNPECALKVRRIISEQLGIPYEHIHPQQSFANDLLQD